MSENESVRISPVPAWIGIILAATWVGVGAYYKLEYASPNALPPIYKSAVSSMFNWTATEAYRLAVTMEFVIVAIALLRPKLGWKLLALQYVIFLVILAQLQLTGATGCGCFGSKINIKPLEMMAVDGPLLLILLLSKPWKRLPKSKFSPLAWIGILVVAVVGLWLPHHEFTTDEDHHAWWSVWSTFQDDTVTTDPSDVPIDPPGNTEDQGGPDTPANVPPPIENALPLFVPLDPNSWVGQMISDTKIGTYLTKDPYEIPDTAHVILYRRSCDHCKEHLNALAINPILDRPVVLIELRSEGDELNENLIEAKPEGAMEFELKSIQRGYGLETPWSLELSGWQVMSVEDTRANMGG